MESGIKDYVLSTLHFNFKLCLTLLFYFVIIKYKLIKAVTKKVEEVSLQRADVWCESVGAFRSSLPSRRRESLMVSRFLP